MIVTTHSFWGSEIRIDQVCETRTSQGWIRFQNLEIRDPSGARSMISIHLLDGCPGIVPGVRKWLIEPEEVTA